MTANKMPVLPEAVAAWPRFTPTRYPFTYAYDLLRSRRPIPGDNSRGDMAGYVTELCEAAGADKLEVCRKLADAYIAYEQALEAADAARESAVAATLANLTTLEQEAKK